MKPSLHGIIKLILRTFDFAILKRALHWNIGHRIYFRLKIEIVSDNDSSYSTIVNNLEIKNKDKLSVVKIDDTNHVIKGVYKDLYKLKSSFDKPTSRLLRGSKTAF